MLNYTEDVTQFKSTQINSYWISLQASRRNLSSDTIFSKIGNEIDARNPPPALFLMVYSNNKQQYFG